MFKSIDVKLAHIQLEYELFILEAAKYIAERLNLQVPGLTYLDLWTSEQCKRAMRKIADIGCITSRAHFITYLLTGYKTKTAKQIENYLRGL